MAETGELPERESMDFDVVIVGAGPAGLAAAIGAPHATAGLAPLAAPRGDIQRTDGGGSELHTQVEPLP